MKAPSLTSIPAVRQIMDIVSRVSTAMSRDDTYAAHLLECAKFFHHECPDAEGVPDTYRDEEHAFEVLKDVLLHDAHHTMTTSIDQPVTMFLNGIDLDTDEPGIVDGERVQRSDPSVTPVNYARVQRPVTSDPCVAKKLSASRVAKLTESATARAEKMQQKEEEKAAYELMSKDEKKAVRERKRDERDKKRAERQQKEATTATTEAGATGAEEATEEVGVEAGVEATEKEATEKEAETKPPGASAKRNVETRDAAERPVATKDSVRKVRKRGDVNKVFESPASHDRHLTALTHIGFNSRIKDAVLSGKDSDAVCVIDGPPGTGKTTALLESLERWVETHPDERAFVCAPTNVGAADLFARAMRRGIVGALALSKEHMPVDVPRLRAVDMATSQVVFATVAGRAGPRLKEQEFSAVFMDEAAHLMEAHAMGLLRPAVATLCMAGDVAQLPAMVSEPTQRLGGGRSLMERLLALGYTPRALTVQHRMHPEILDFPNRLGYDGRLVTAETRADKELPPDVRPYSVHHVAGRESPVGTSHENVDEAREAIRLATECAALGLSTVILVPYQGQLRRILAAGSGIPVCTVDSYQGKESDAVVLSLVRTDMPGFWDDARRLTVALTRAKHVLRVCTNADSWRDGETPLSKMVRDAEARGIVGC